MVRRNATTAAHMRDYKGRNGVGCREEEEEINQDTNAVTPSSRG